MLKKVYTEMIKRKYYTEEEFKEKLDLLVTFGRLTADDYTELMLLLDQTYPAKVSETPVPTGTVSSAPTVQGQIEQPQQ